MAKNPFKQNQDFEQKPNRNTFDLSFMNNLTANFGTLYPVMCKEVLPGDNFKIDAAFALRFMPLVFPVQTRCRAHLHFFYVRNRNLWKDFPDFVAENKESSQPGQLSPLKKLQLPYITQATNTSLFATGSLGDYLGIPTVAYGAVGNFIPLEEEMSQCTTGNSPYYPFNDSGARQTLSSDLSASAALSTIQRDSVSFDKVIDSKSCAVPSDKGVWSYIGSFGLNSPIQGEPLIIKSNQKYVLQIRVSADTVLSSTGKLGFVIYGGDSELSMTPRRFYIPDLSFDYSTNSYTGSFEIDLGLDLQRYMRIVVLGADGMIWQDDSEAFLNSFTLYPSDSYWTEVINLSTVKPTTAGTSLPTPIRVYGNSPGEIPISALPFRAYESIYNSFYRDARNNPFIVNGEVEYNKYLPTDDGGLDTTRYKLYNRNWELDQFTSCVQSPQQGVAPLVGISSLGEVTFDAGDEGGLMTFSTETADDADTITRVNVNSNIPNSVARSIVNVVTSGISINDFRNVNAYQRWKETNIRRGYKFKDQIKARWGVDIANNVLDMPEFLGGVSCDVDINTVSQSVETETNPLGSYAGQATAFGSSKNTIHQYCDEPGFIMAIFSVVPEPIYTQFLPKHFTKFSPLDFYQPEFGQIGMQPVTNAELCPVETTYALRSDLNGVENRSASEIVFGYQRPWYDYLSSLNEAHGLFRTELRNFLLTRVFGGIPKLGPDFLTINHQQMNNVFNAETGDKILGCIRFNITAARPIPEVSVPAIK